MAKINLKESIAALKKLKEEELEKLATDAEIAGEPEKNEANEDAIEEDTIPSNDEILQKIEKATEDLETELSNKITSDEYRADNEDWDGIKDKNIQYWTDKPLKFVKDPEIHKLYKPSNFFRNFKTIMKVHKIKK